MNLIAQLLRLEPKPTTRAGRVLANRRRLAGRRHGPGTRWTGFVFGRKRAWVGQPVVLPDDSVGWIKQVQGGYACVKTSKVDPEDGPIHDYMAVTRLRRYKLPEAVLLGQMKRGVKEVPSALKAMTSRANGKLPPRPGSRPRGRPRAHRHPSPARRTSPRRQVNPVPPSHEPSLRPDHTTR